MSTRGNRQRAAHDVMRDVNRALVAQVRELSGADSEAVRKAAGALAKQIRISLSTPGADRHTSLKTRRVRGMPSTPGAPPAMQSGRLKKAVRSGVVQGIRRVGFSDFRARLLEFGATVQAAPARKKGDLTGRVRADGRKTTYRKDKAAITARVIAPRPFMARSLAAAEPEMADVVVGPLSKLGGAP